MKTVGLVVVAVLIAGALHGAPGQAQPAPKPSGDALTQDPGQGFPNRPLRYIVPFPPGGSTDIVARIIAAGLTDALREQVVIDNRGGAAGTLGAEIAAHATADGYTLFACNIASLAVSPSLYKKLGYDAVKDFAPVGLIGSTANALVVHPSVPAKTVAEFIEYAKARPGKLNYASAGVGTSPQLSMELFKMSAGLDIVHVAYKGGGPALADVVGGHVQAMFGTVPTFLGAIKGGKIRVLGVTSKTRVPDLPDIPTLAESGMPDFEVISWQGLCTPAGVSRPILKRIREALASVLALPDTRKRLADQGMQLTAMSADEFAQFIRSERAKWSKLISDVGIKPQ